jgi:D-threo-aldose 1-dehydrogenase
MTTEIQKRTLGRTGVEVSELALGTGPLGGFPGKPVDEETAQETLAAAWDCGIRFFDTAPWYGLGMSEHRLGRFLRSQPRDSFVLSSKVGRILEAPETPRRFRPETFWSTPLPYRWHFDYRRDAILRSFEDSLQRLGLNRVDFLLVHDIERGAHGSDPAVAARYEELDSGGGFAALEQLRDSGVIDGIGVGLNEVDAVGPFLERFEVDFVLLAGRYTLLDQSALKEAYPACQERGVAIIAAAVFNTGILAAGSIPGATFENEVAPQQIREQVEHLRETCTRYGVELPAAALHFPRLHESVCTVLAGAAHPQEARQNVQLFNCKIPDELWVELRHQGLLGDGVPRASQQ